MYGYIYKTTNLVNGKIYIGKKKGNFTQSYKGSGRYLRNAFVKYGFENFSVEIIEYCETLQIQNEREKYWIKFYMDRNVPMYNISKGGDGGDTYYALSESDKHDRISKISEASHFHNLSKTDRIKAWETRRKNGTDVFSVEQRMKMSKSHLGHKPSKESIAKRVKSRQGYKHSAETIEKIRQANLGRKVSADTRKKLSESSKKRCGKLNSFYGKTHSEEVRKHIGEKSKEWFSTHKIIWVNDGDKNTRIDILDLDKYEKLGYKRGRIKWAKH